MSTAASPTHRLHLPSLATARLAHVLDEGGRLQRRKVLDLDGALIHADHAAWLEAQLAADRGDAAATRRRLHAEDYLLTACSTQTIYLVIDRLAPDQSDFIQIEITLEDEFHDQPLFKYESSWRSFTGLRDLLLDCDVLHSDARQRYRPTA